MLTGLGTKIVRAMLFLLLRELLLTSVKIFVSILKIKRFVFFFIIRFIAIIISDVTNVLLDIFIRTL